MYDGKTNQINHILLIN